LPPLAPTFLKVDLVHALSPSIWPFVFVFLFMLVFDTIGTFIGVCEQAGFIKDNRLPRAKPAMLSDAIGTVAGAAPGTWRWMNSRARYVVPGRPACAGSGLSGPGRKFNEVSERHWAKA
jgi:AGZA family xanthine/uracil permease-like MFS transporter